MTEYDKTMLEDAASSIADALSALAKLSPDGKTELNQASHNEFCQELKSLADVLDILTN